MENKYIYSLFFIIKNKNSDLIEDYINPIYSKDKFYLIKFAVDCFNEFMNNRGLDYLHFNDIYDYMIEILIINSDSKFCDTISKKEETAFYTEKMKNINSKNIFEYVTTLGNQPTKEFYDYFGNLRYAYTQTDLTLNPEIYIAQNDDINKKLMYNIGDIVQIKGSKLLYKVIYIPNYINRNILDYNCNIGIESLDNKDIQYEYHQNSLTKVKKNVVTRIKASKSRE